MTLSSVNFPVEYEWGRRHALVFSAAMASRLAEVQDLYGDKRHVPFPRALADGRFMLRGEILTECVPGGILYGGFSHLDAGRFDEIEVLPIADAVALLPADPVGP